MAAPTTWMEVADTAVKIGLGAVIAAVASYVVIVYDDENQDGLPSDGESYSVAQWAHPDGFDDEFDFYVLAPEERAIVAFDHTLLYKFEGGFSFP